MRHVCYLSMASHVDAFSCWLVILFFVDLFFLTICSFINFNKAFFLYLIDIQYLIQSRDHTKSKCVDFIVFLYVGIHIVCTTKTSYNIDIVVSIASHVDYFWCCLATPFIVAAWTCMVLKMSQGLPRSSQAPVSLCEGYLPLWDTELEAINFAMTFWYKRPPPLTNSATIPRGHHR